MSVLGVVVVAIGSMIIQRYDHRVAKLIGTVIVILGCYVQHWERWM